MKKQLATLLLFGLVVGQSFAATIQNGDFQTCDYSGWSQFSDLDPVEPNDFTIANNAGDCSAVIAADASDAFTNILFQDLDLSAQTDSALMLSFDFSVDSELTNQDFGFADYFSIYLFDGFDLVDNTGGLGAIFDNIDINGPASYVQSFMLDSSFNNALGWSLEFQVVSNFDFAPAFLTINSVSLVEVPANATPVSTPSIFALLVLFIAFTASVRRSTK